MQPFNLTSVEDIMKMTSSQPQQEMAGWSVLDEYNRRPLKASAVRAIQTQRGEEPCYSTDKRYNCTEPCEWRKDCTKLRAVWLR